jgi:hypothetical protein
MQTKLDADASVGAISQAAMERMLVVGVVSMEHPFRALTAQNREIWIGIDDCGVQDFDGEGDSDSNVPNQ